MTDSDQQLIELVRQFQETEDDSIAHELWRQIERLIFGEDTD
jgi:hypothetical protein